MQITVFGATGATGQSFVQQALQRGHELTVFVRRPDAFAPEPALTVVTAELDDRDAVTKAVAGADAVVNILGPSKKDPGNPVISRATKLIADVAIEQGVRRHIVVTAWGIGPRREETPWFFRTVLLNTVLKKSFGVKADQEAILAAPLYRESLDLTIVAPGQLTGGLDHAYRCTDNGRTVKSKVTRPGLAAFLLDTAEQATWVDQSVVVGS